MKNIEKISKFSDMFLLDGNTGFLAFYFIA